MNGNYHSPIRRSSKINLMKISTVRCSSLGGLTRKRVIQPAEKEAAGGTIDECAEAAEKRISETARSTKTRINGADVF